MELSSQDCCRLRLSSPAVADTGLPEAFWASRFAEGKEYHHIFEARDARPRSWRALYFGIKAVEQTSTNLADRRRIWGLASLLQDVLREVSLDSCAGRPLQCFFDMTGDEDHLPWLTARRALKDPEDPLIDGCRALRRRMIPVQPPSGLVGLFVSFVRLQNGAFVSGIRIQQENGAEERLGYVNPHYETVITVPSSRGDDLATGLLGFHLALDISGIKGVAALFEDGTMSPWAGEHENYPKWHLADDSGDSISSIKGEFDAFKLVSLSICTSSSTHNPATREYPFRSTCLWSPDIPAKQLLFDGTENDYSNTGYNTVSMPFSTVMFSGSAGEDLSKLVEAVVWVFDVVSITGFEFVYVNGESRIFGLPGPYPDHMIRQFDTSGDFRVTLSIDGPGGERIVSVEVQEEYHEILGLKICTNRGREGLFPQPPNRPVGFEWTPVAPSGSVVVGFYSVHSLTFGNFGLISINSANNEAI